MEEQNRINEENNPDCILQFSKFTLDNQGWVIVAKLVRTYKIIWSWNQKRTEHIVQKILPQTSTAHTDYYFDI